MRWARATALVIGAVVVVAGAAPAGAGQPAEVSDDISSPAPHRGIRARPRARVQLHKVRLFGRAHIAGGVRPTRDPNKVTLRLLRNGKTLFRRSPSLTSGRFATRFRVRRPGSYRVAVSLRRKGRRLAYDSSRSRSTNLPRLGPGSHSPYVKLLEGRLRRLSYHLRGFNWRYDYRTVDAVRAFNKVQRRPRSGTVSPTTWRALANPRRPRARGPRSRAHVEIDQTKQVLYVVRRGRIIRILHTSTGANGVTRDGVFNVFRKIGGFSPGRLYYPSYFDGLRAIHGWPDVPVSAASHGCARVPMWAAKWIYRRALIGTQIRIYH